MNYYRRYIGDYLADTQALNMIEDGAYCRLLDYYYASESPLPADMAKVYAIARAVTAIEKKGVREVLDRHFILMDDGYHNTRADKELGVALPKLEKLRQASRANGLRGGRPKKNPDDGQKETQIGYAQEPNPDEKKKQPPSSNLQPKPPIASTPKFETGVQSAGALAAAGLAALKPEPLSLAEAKISSADATPAGMLAAVCVANGVRATAFHPLVLDWVRDGITVTRLKDAIATARIRKPAPETIPPAYLDTILQDRAKPADARWKSDDSAAENLCRELGIPGAKMNEQRQEWHGRISRALMDRARGQVA